MFDRYLNKPEATTKEFLQSWFKTGDYVTVQKGVFRILGRISQDIIKKAGYKISALEIENYLLEHASVREVCVYGVADPKYGEEIACVFAGDLSESDLETFAKNKLSGYKVPRLWTKVATIQRNQMGKVSKKLIK